MGDVSSGSTPGAGVNSNPVSACDSGKSRGPSESADGSKMTLVLPPLAVANMREGDDVSLDVLVTPRR